MKYVGSKAKFVKDLMPIIQSCILRQGITTYWEPFVGGGNMIVNISCDRKVGSDKDEIPVSLLGLSMEECSELYERLPKPYPSKEHYMDVLKNPTEYDSLYRAAILLFGSYNARVYGGYYGAFANTKDGGIRNYFEEAFRNYEKQLPLMQGTELLVGSYDSIQLPLNDTTLVYCDPPYGDTLEYSDAFDTEAFWNWVRKISKDCFVLVSEYSAPEDFIPVWQKDVTLHINHRGKAARTEGLFTYKDGLYNKNCM